MNFEGCLGKPVIDFDPDYHFYMQIDTGCTRNWYFPSFLAKCDIQKDYFIQCIINNIRQNEPDISEAHPDDKELSHFLEEEWSKYIKINGILDYHRVSKAFRSNSFIENYNRRVKEILGKYYLLINFD